MHYKRRIFQTSAHEEESTYQAIYYRIAQLTEDQISKHNNKLISAEAEREIRENFEKYFEVEAGCWRVKRTLQLEDVPAGVLLGIAIQSLWGNKKHTAMKIEQNRFFANRAIEFLVVVKKYEPAILAKRLVLLYGFQEYLSPQVVQAKALLGVHLLDEPQMDMTASKLEQLGSLERLPNRHANTTQVWHSQADFDSMLPKYHPRMESLWARAHS